MELKKSMICIAALAAVFSLSGCKDDTEPGEMTSGITGLYINEVCSGGGSDWIELYNASDKEISLGGMHVQDNKGNEDQYTFPDGASIAAKGFIVLEEGSDFAFGISGDGDEIHLLDEGYAVIDEIIVPAMDDYYTYYRTVDGGNAWDTIYGGTKGRSNTGTPDNPEEGGDNEPVTPEDPTADYTAIKLNELNGNDKFHAGIIVIMQQNAIAIRLLDLAFHKTLAVAVHIRLSAHAVSSMLSPCVSPSASRNRVRSGSSKTKDSRGGSPCAPRHS